MIWCYIGLLSEMKLYLRDKNMNLFHFVSLELAMVWLEHCLVVAQFLPFWTRFCFAWTFICIYKELLTNIKVTIIMPALLQCIDRTDIQNYTRGLCLVENDSRLKVGKKIHKIWEFFFRVGEIMFLFLFLFNLFFQTRAIQSSLTKCWSVDYVCIWMDEWCFMLCVWKTSLRMKTHKVLVETEWKRIPHGVKRF